MKVDPRAQVDRVGISIVQLKFAKIGWLFREQSVSDYGIDAHVEIVENETATGQLIALQVKSGESWRSEKTVDGVVFRGDLQHLTYWREHSLPVLIVLYDPTTEECYWQVVTDETVTMTGKGWKLVVPFNQRIDDASKQVLSAIGGKIVPSTRYSILSLRDVSTASAKRYSANVLLSGEFTRREIADTVRGITEDLKHREYYKSQFAESRWAGQEAQVVTLFVYVSLDDVRNVNWVCRCQWISPTLKVAPMRWSGTDIGNDIVLDWNKLYIAWSRFQKQHTVTKETYLEQVVPILRRTVAIVEQAVSLTNAVAATTLPSSEYAEQMRSLVDPMTTLYFEAGNTGLAPAECSALESKFQEVMALAHNVFSPFTDGSPRAWSGKSRDYLVRQAVQNYSRELTYLRYELEKVK